MTGIPANGLFLDGPLNGYKRHDSNSDGVLVAEEVLKLSDFAMKRLLDSAMSQEANSTYHIEMGNNYNNHHAFFASLSATRIASLFSNRLLDEHYLTNTDGREDTVIDIPAVLAEILRLQTPQSYLEADRFLLTSRIFSDKWDGIFAALDGRYTDYITSRTSLSVAGLANADRADKWDLNHNGRIEKIELQFINAGETEDGNTSMMIRGIDANATQISPLLIDGANSLQHQMATAYILSGVNPFEMSRLSIAIFQNESISQSEAGRYWDIRLAAAPNQVENEFTAMNYSIGFARTAGYRNLIGGIITSDIARSNFETIIAHRSEIHIHIYIIPFPFNVPEEEDVPPPSSGKTI